MERTPSGHSLELTTTSSDKTTTNNNQHENNKNNNSSSDSASNAKKKSSVLTINLRKTIELRQVQQLPTPPQSPSPSPSPVPAPARNIDIVHSTSPVSNSSATASTPRTLTTQRQKTLKRQKFNVYGDEQLDYAADRDEDDEDEHEHNADSRLRGAHAHKVAFHKFTPQRHSTLNVNIATSAATLASDVLSNVPATAEDKASTTNDSNSAGNLSYVPRCLKYELSLDSTILAAAELGSSSQQHNPCAQLQRDNSVQSDSSRYSSVDSLLESRKPDPEAILINLGFGPVGSEDILSRIPRRFLKPSQVHGIDTEAFVKRLQLANSLADHSVLGYRGLTGNPDIPPSSIVAKIMERFEVNQRKKSMGSLEQTKR